MNNADGFSPCSCSLLKSLIALCEKESSKGKFRVILDYDNYQDGARVLDGGGQVLGVCYDQFLSAPEDETGVERQFMEAIRQALSKNESSVSAPNCSTRVAKRREALEIVDSLAIKSLPPELFKVWSTLVVYWDTHFPKLQGIKKDYHT